MNKRIYTTLFAAVLLLAATSANAQTNFIPEGWDNYQCTVLSETDKTAEIRANPDIDFGTGFFSLPDTVTNPATNTRYVVTRIAENGFRGKAVRAFSIQNTVKAIGRNAFADGNVLELHVKAENPPLLELSEDGKSPLTSVKSVKLYTQTISAYLQTDGWNAIKGWLFKYGDYWFDTSNYHDGELCIGSYYDDAIPRPDKLEIPATVKIADYEFTVTSIAADAFTDEPFTEVFIPDGVTQIGGAAFATCPELTKVTLPSKLEAIEGLAFKKCPKLADIHVPDGVTHIGTDAFWDTPFEAGFPDGPVYLGKVLYLYKGEIPAHYTVKDGTTEVSNGTFSDSKLESIKLPSSLKRCLSNAFYNCNLLKDVDIPDFGPWFGIDFENEPANPMFKLWFNNICTLTVNGKTLQELKELRIQEGIQKLGKYSGMCLDMSGCKLVLPETFNDLDWTDALSTVNAAPDTMECYTPGVVSVSQSDFTLDFFNRTVLVVPAELLEKYKVSGGWKDFKEITAVTFEENKFKFGIYSQVNRTATLLEYTDKTFAGEVVIPDTATIGGVDYSVTRLAKEAFFNCKNLKEITLGKNIERIGQKAFAVSGENKSQISKIRCNNPVPPVLGAHYSSGEYHTTFMPETYETATVYVPVGSIDAYKAAEEWKEFKNIVEDVSLDVESIAEESVSVTAADGIITVAGAENAAVEVYAITGQLLYRGNETAIALPVKGICIVRVNGKAFKVIL